MAKFVGRVRFMDGVTRFFIYNGGVDSARPRLFEDRTQVDENWDDPQLDAPRNPGRGTGDEIVDVYPYCDGSYSDEVMFRTFANRHTKLITGPLAEEDAEKVDVLRIGSRPF